jgi:hypothetical protein
VSKARGGQLVCMYVQYSMYCTEAPCKMPPGRIGRSTSTALGAQAFALQEERIPVAGIKDITGEPYLRLITSSPILIWFLNRRAETITARVE